MFGWKVIPRFGPVSLHGIGIMFGYLAGTILWVRRGRARGFDEDKVWSAASWAVVGAILGARVAYVAGHFDEFNSPVEWLRIWEGGISLVGGMMGGWLAAYLYARTAGIHFFDLADLAAPGLALGVALGRSGDLAIGDHLGKETSGWWGWEYRGGELISPPPCITPQGNPVYSSIDGCIEPGMVVHQTALYDAIWSLVILAILTLLERNPRRRGFLALAWASLYAVGRIATDFLRVDKTWLGLGLTGSQITSIIVLIVCVYLIVRYGGVPSGVRVSVAATTGGTTVLPGSEMPQQAQVAPIPEEPADSSAVSLAQSPTPSVLEIGHEVPVADPDEPGPRESEDPESP